MTQNILKQITRIFKDKEVDEVNKKPRPKSAKVPSERLLVSYDTFLENVKKHEAAANNNEKPNWYNSISKAKKWKKRRFTNPFHQNEEEAKPSVQPHTDLLHRFMKSPHSDKPHHSKSHFATFRHHNKQPQKRPHVGIIVSPELSEKVEIGSSFIPMSCSLQSLSQLPPATFLDDEKNRPRSSTSVSYNSLFSKSTPHLTSWTLPSDQETVRTSYTSHGEEEEVDKHSIDSIKTNDGYHLQPSELKLHQDFYTYNEVFPSSTDKHQFSLAQQVRVILGDAIELADKELEQD